MEIVVGLTNSVGVKDISQIIVQLERGLNLKFGEIDYNSTLKTIYVGTIHLAPEFDQFFKLMKPKYYKSKGLEIESLEFEIKLDNYVVDAIDNHHIKGIIANEIFTSLIYFISKDKKIRDFDLKAFRLDFENFIKQHSYTLEGRFTRKALGDVAVEGSNEVDNSTELQESLDNELKQTEISRLLNLIVEDFRKIQQMEGLNIHYQDAIKNGLERFDQSGLDLNSDDEDEICNKIEELMEIVNLESSGGHLNRWRYGFNPNEK